MVMVTDKVRVSFKVSASLRISDELEMIDSYRQRKHESSAAYGDYIGPTNSSTTTRHIALSDAGSCAESIDFYPASTCTALLLQPPLVH